MKAVPRWINWKPFFDKREWTMAAVNPKTRERIAKPGTNLCATFADAVKATKSGDLGIGFLLAEGGWVLGDHVPRDSEQAEINKLIRANSAKAEPPDAFASRTLFSSEMKEETTAALPVAKLKRADDDSRANTEQSPPKSSRADDIVVLAHERYRLGRTSKSEGFAVEIAGANVATRLTGAKISQTLSHAYYVEHKRVPGSTAIADALDVLRGEAAQSPAEELAIRLGRDGSTDAIVLDLCGADGKAVVVDRDGWRIVERSPILFERTELTDGIPIPVLGGEIGELRNFLNVGDDDFSVLIGWLLSAMMPELSHPILMLGGGQGTGKTTAARFLCSLIDPSGAPIRPQPRDPETWALTLANSWTTIIDNISAIPEWWSDALCKAVTGDGFVRRQLYSDRGLSVVNFRRVVVLTSIDAGALRGDLGERLVLVDLQPIDEHGRRAEGELEASYTASRPRLLGALLSLLSRVLAHLPAMKLATLPRMADFARVLAAMDAELGTHALTAYEGQSRRIAEDVLEADPVGTALITYMETRYGFRGNMKALLDAIKPAEQMRGFPMNARALSARLKRLAPALESHGIHMIAPSPTDKTRMWTIEIARTAQPPETRTGDVENAVDARAVHF